MGLDDYHISELTLGNGWLGIGHFPGRNGAYQADLNNILAWGSGLVLTMNTGGELARGGLADFGNDLNAAEVEWRHLPIPDFGAPPPDTQELWTEASELAHRLLRQSGKVFAHCYAGCGRSGMALLRLMVESGEPPLPALQRLRAVRPCAVETEAQFTWAEKGMPE